MNDEQKDQFSWIVQRLESRELQNKTFSRDRGDITLSIADVRLLVDEINKPVEKTISIIVMWDGDPKKVVTVPESKADETLVLLRAEHSEINAEYLSELRELPKFRNLTNAQIVNEEYEDHRWYDAHPVIIEIVPEQATTVDYVLPPEPELPKLVGYSLLYVISFDDTDLQVSGMVSPLPSREAVAEWMSKGFMDKIKGEGFTVDVEKKPPGALFVLRHESMPKLMGGTILEVREGDELDLVFKDKPFGLHVQGSGGSMPAMFIPGETSNE